MISGVRGGEMAARMKLFFELSENRSQYQRTDDASSSEASIDSTHDKSEI